MKNKNYLLSLTTALLCTTQVVTASNWDSPVPQGSSPVNGESYYIYNSSKELFLDVSGERVNLSAIGVPIAFEQQAGEGEWMMRGVNGYLYADLEYVGCDGGDSDANIIWYVEQQAAGYSYIRPSKNDPDFLWSSYPNQWTGIETESMSLKPIIEADKGDINWYIISESDYSNFESKLNLHKMMTELDNYGYDVSELIAVYNSATTKSEFDAAIDSKKDILDQLRLENATEYNPYDCTSIYLRNADLTENWISDGHDVPGWTMQPSHFCEMSTLDSQGFYDDDKTLGSWSATAFGDNKIYQQVTSLKNGKYRFGNYGVWIRHTGQEGDPITGAYIYAKVGDKIFKEPLADTGWWRGLSEVVFECRTGDAELGIMFEGTNVGQCIILDFKLEYLGEVSATARLAELIAKSQSLIDEGAICNSIIETLNNDISTANTLITSGNTDECEAHFSKFEKDYESALLNKDAYVKLATLLTKAAETLELGASDEMSALSDYLMEKELDEGINEYIYDNEAINQLITELTALVDKAANSVTAAGTDVTNLLVNGKFETTGGWIATQGSFGINPDLKVLEQWWGDFKAEQTITNIPNGKYRFEIQAFKWCSWDWGQSDTDWSNGDGSPTYGVSTKVRLNDDEVTIQNVFACGPTDITEGYQSSAGYFVPNDSKIAMKFFELGLYNNVVETTVTNNTLKIEFDCSNTGFWNLFYNPRLIYVGADTEEAFTNLKNAMAEVMNYSDKKMEGAILKGIESAMESAEGILADKNLKYDDINSAKDNLLALIPKAVQSIKEYDNLAQALAMAEEALNDDNAALTEAGKELKSLYDSTKADFDSQYPTITGSEIPELIDKIRTLINKIKIEAGFNIGDDITNIIINPSFENLIGQEINVGGSAHTVPYGWTMTVNGVECHTAQELADAGINSYTAIEKNDYTTEGEYSYCLLSAPVPDTYLWQSINGLPAGTYKVSVDMNVTYDGGCSRLTGQRLLVNNVAQYYGKEEFYIESELNALHPEEIARTFAGYDEVNSTTTGESGDMGNMSTLSVEVSINDGDALILGVRTDNNKVAMNRNYEENYWDCCGRYKLDNFRLTYVSNEVNSIENVETVTTHEGDAYNLMGIKVDPKTARGIFIMNGKKYMRR